MRKAIRRERTSKRQNVTKEEANIKDLARSKRLKKSEDIIDVKVTTLVKIASDCGIGSMFGVYLYMDLIISQTKINKGYILQSIAKICKRDNPGALKLITLAFTGVIDGMKKQGKKISPILQRDYDFIKDEINKANISK